MAVAATVKRVTKVGSTILAIGTVTFSGSYTTNGDTVSLAGQGIPASNAPLYVEIHGIAGFKYEYVPGTNLTDGKIIVRVEQTIAINTPLGEHSAASYVSGVTGDTVKFLALFVPLR